MPKKKSKARPIHKSNFLIKLQLLAGLACILIAFVAFSSIKFENHKTVKPSTEAKVSVASVKETVKTSGLFKGKARATDLPSEIVIPSVNINTKITESQIIDGYWEISETTASHGIGSAYPGEVGNSVIFAHAREGLFYNLKDLKEGSDIYVLTKNKWYRYKVTEIKSVTPEEIEVVQPTKEERLTLFTCSGYQDEKRLIVVAEPI